MANNIRLDFKHEMSAHCENGVTRNLLKFYGIELSEAMVFGLGSGLFFTYLPFLKLNGAPVVSFRPMPGKIFAKVNKYIGNKIVRRKFSRNPDKAMAELDKVLFTGTPVGMLVGVYHLTYFPAPLRFHFNAHNIVVIGKENNNYIVSDPIMENIEQISAEDLKRVRYAKGTYKPKGRMYYFEKINKDFDLKKSINKSVRHTAKMMIKAPGGIAGVSGIRNLAKHIKKWPVKYSKKKAALYLGSVIRMQEEIGTGGAGFRFLYAAFLQEAGKMYNSEPLLKASEDMTKIGDMWREFAIDAARVCKNRQKDGESYNSIAEKLLKIADFEENLFKKLIKIKL